MPTKPDLHARPSTIHSIVKGHGRHPVTFEPLEFTNAHAPEQRLPPSIIQMGVNGTLQHQTHMHSGGALWHEFRDQYGKLVILITCSPEPDVDTPDCCPTCGHGGGTHDILGRRFHRECVRGFQEEYDHASRLADLSATGM